MASDHVPFLLDLATSPVCSADHDDASGSLVMVRPRWKQYLQSILPHAERGVRSFILTCLEEGRVADDGEENNCNKG